MTRLFRILLALAVLLLAGLGACKKKPPKLTKAECQTFCKRLVPCFAKRLAHFAMDTRADVKECIDNCRSKEGQRHAHLLHAMKRCGHLKECDKLLKCFDKVMKSL